MSPTSSVMLDYELGNDFFDLVKGTEVRQGKVSVTVEVIKALSSYEISFYTEGVVEVECDRCLGNVGIHVETDNKLLVTLGEAYSETSDEHVTVSEEEGIINIAWFIYEFIVLALPLKRTHKAGECDENMSSKLRELCVEEAGEEEENAQADENRRIDPRWETLRNLIGDN